MTEKVDPKFLGIPNICFSLADDENYSEQRKTRGFDDSETWDLSDTIARFIIPRLKIFKKNECSTPIDLNKQQWEQILDQITNAFELIVRDDGARTFSTEEERMVNEGLDMFRKWFLHLWN